MTDLAPEAVIICWGGRLRPLGEDVKEARDVLDNLSSVLAVEITTEPPLPDLARMVDQIVVLCVRWLHGRPHGRLLAAPCL